MNIVQLIRALIAISQEESPARSYGPGDVWELQERELVYFSVSPPLWPYSKLTVKGEQVLKDLCCLIEKLAPKPPR